VRAPPVFPSLRGYRTEWLRSDVVAGLTVWAVLVPEALAYATIAGVSPVVGLYAAPAALIFYAAFGSSRHLITGPMSATAALSAATVAELATAGSPQFVAFTTTVAIAVGAVAVVAGVARLGFLADFISEPVLKGFIIGLALTIIVGQLPDLVGVGKGEGNFFHKLWDWISDLGSAGGATVVVGVGSLALVLALKRFAPIVPASLVAVVLGIVAVAVGDLDQHGVAIVGHIDAGLPSVGYPDSSWSDFMNLLPGAVGVMLVGFAEGLGAAKTYAARAHYEVDANRELLGLGAANVASGLASGMVVNGSLSKTAVNGGAGAKSQVSGLVAAAVTVVTLLFLTGLFEQLPEATLAAVVIAAVMELVDVGALADLYRASSSRLERIYGVAARPDLIAAVAAMLGVLIFDTLPGLVIGIAVSLMLLLYRASRPNVATLGALGDDPEVFGDVRSHPRARTIQGVTVLRVEGGLFFANADTVRDRILAAGRRDGVRAIVLDAESIGFLDVSAARMLRTLHEDLARADVRLVVAHDIGQVRDVLAAVGVDIESHRSLADAVAAARRP